MMRLKAENSVCGLLQVFVMHYAKENVHQVPNQTDLQQKKISFLWWLPYG